jgi:hypothetical protein
MAERTIAQKLLIKPGQRILAVNPPDDYGSLVGGLPDGAHLVPTPTAEAEVVHLFVRDRAELAASWPSVAESLRPDTILWVSYPRRGPGVKTDLNRDHGWGPLHDAGWDPVTQVSLNDTWSAMRWRQDPVLRASREARGARVERD